MSIQILLLTTDNELAALVCRSFEKLPDTLSLERIHNSSDLFLCLNRLTKGSLVLLDWDFADPPAHKLLKELIKHDPLLPIIILLQEGDEYRGAELIGKEAADYAVKSLKGLARLPVSIKNVVHHAMLKFRWNRMQKISLELTSELDFKEVLPRVFVLAEEMVGAQAGALLPMEEIHDVLPSPYLHNLSIKSADAELFIPALTAGSPIFLNNYPDKSDALPELVKSGVHGLVASPLIIGRRVLGSLCLFDLTGHIDFSFDDAELMQTVARHLAVAIENIRLLHRERLAFRESEAVQRVSPALTASLELQSVLDSILAAALDLIPADIAHIFLYSEKRLTFGAAVGPGERWEKPFSEPRPDGLTYTVARNALPVVVTDMASHPLFKDTSPEWKGSILGLPLKIGKRVVGVMNISRLKPGPFAKAELRIWELLANQAAIAIENARLYQAERSKHSEAEALRKAALALTSTVSLDEVFDRILIELQNVVPFDSASVQLLKGDHLEIIGGRGFSDLIELIGVAFPAHGDNPNSLVLESKQPVIIDNVHTRYPVFSQEPHSASNIHGWLGVPLLFGDRVIGMLALDKHQPGFYVKDHAEIAMSYAAQAAVAIENARLFEAERKQRLQTEALQAAGAILSGTLDLSEVLERILTELGKVISYDSASVLLIEGDLLRIVAGRGLPEPSAVGKLFSGDTLLENELKQTNLPIVLDDAQNHPGFKGWGGTGYVHGWMGVPLLTGDRMIGHLTLDSHKFAAYSQADAELAMSFANQAAIAVENARLHQSLKDQLKALQESQARLVQSEKLAAIGKLVAGVAHELNNPLTSIIGIAQFLQSCDVSEEIIQDLDNLVDEAHRTAEIVRNLLDFARQNVPERKPVQINDILNSILKLLAYELQSQNIECTTNLSRDLPFTMADSNQLQQVFINLLNNACQAIAMRNTHGRGRLIICDIRMPGISGPELYRKVQEKNPELVSRIIFITGDTVSPNTLNFLEEVAPPYLSKPFEMKELINKVETMLKESECQ